MDIFMILVNYDVDNILDIQKYLMKKNGIIFRFSNVIFQF